jgi:hypothetical protein
MSYASIEAAANRAQLTVLGGFHLNDKDEGLDGFKTLLLLGPHEPGFWAHFTAAPEWSDGAPDPMDRWSTRVIGDLADTFNARALFPFGGPPFQPFMSWALRSGQAWQSPVSLLVHSRAGLMVSYRGALALPDRIELPAAAPKPCETCDKPCLTACPSDALGAQGYDVPKCHAYLDTDDGGENLQLGCNVRRACPVSQSYARLSEQSAYHMSQFHGVGL